ncbi:MAG TPA: alpha/beta hydrolase [Solirubrobacteraceae bacterium]|jgi:pimeloyl-ACP methyl ester carboxylesterase|nr:alpha/beta hydrolase [Solirubrobacteraceae bacterium]
MPPVSDRNATIGTMPVFWREAPVVEGVPPPLYMHGVPTNSDDWLAPRERRARRPRWKRWWRAQRSTDEWLEPPAYATGFLERTGGLAPDLPGFGRSGKAGNLDYTIDGYADFIERYLDLLSVERVSLVMHDWGSVGLAFAQRHPERVARLVVIDAVPFLPGYRWHRTARLWRTPLLGELAMGATTRAVMRFSTREARPSREPMPDAWLDSVLDHFDQGTQRAILRLYRSGSSDVLAAAGARLRTLSMPALVVWGQADPYIPARFGRAYAAALPSAELLELPDAGHWPWFDRPDVIARVADFLTAAAPGAAAE